MQVSKWGNSLAVRLPSAVVEALDLKAGDEIDIQVVGNRQLDIDRNSERQEALKRLLARRIPLPPGWKFDREEANAG